MSVEVSVVLPAYNEEATIERTIQTTLDTLASFLPEGGYEVLVAEDGCDDRTPDIAARIAGENRRVRHVHSDARLGRGGALERAFRLSSGETLAYFDTDLATDTSHIEELIESVRSDGYDIATGSRWVSGSVVDRPMKRSVPSRGFNILVRQMLGSGVRDHQCGFKAFDRTTLFSLLDTIEDKHWFWDTEVLVRAQQRDYRVKEFPIEWESKGDTKVDLIRDVFGMGSQVLRCWWEFAIQPRITRRVTVAGGSFLVVAAIALMSLYINPMEVIEQMRKANPQYIVAATFVYLLSWPLRGLRYRDILQELGYEEDVGFLTGAVFISQTGNLVIPARVGDAVRAYVVKMRRNIPYASGFASLAVERVFDLLTITVLAGVMFLGMATMGLDISGLGGEISGAANSDSEISGRIALIVAVGVGVAAISVVLTIIVSARSDRNLVRTVIKRISSDSYADYVSNIIEQFVGDVQAVAGDRRSFALIGASSVLVWTLDVVTALLVFAAFDVSIPLVTFIAVGFFAVSVGNLSKVIPLSPGGMGLYEGAFSLIVIVFTPIAAPLALSAAILDHAVKNIVTVVGGIASTLILNISLTTAVEESRDIEPANTD